MLDDTTYDLIIETFKGKGGDIEAESILLDNNFDRKEGYVQVYAHGKWAAIIAKRCRSAIISAKIHKEAVDFKIKRSAFRGIHTAFKVTK